MLLCLVTKIAKCIENFISCEKKISRHFPISTRQTIKTFLTHELTQYSKKVELFPQASRSLSAATAADYETPCQVVFVLDSPTPGVVLAAQAVQEVGTKRLPIDFAVKTFNCLLE